jgi:membrane-associated phospholipid phosphatase
MRREREEQHVAISSRRPTPLRLARLVTEVLAPAPIAAALLVVVAIHSSSTPAAALGWALLAVLFASAIPFVFVLWGVRRRRLTDRHVGLREQRLLPLLVGIASVLVGLALLSAFGAPQELVALVGAMMVGLVVSLLVTFSWKMSMHTAVAGGAVTIVALVFGAEWLVLFLIVGLIGWARVKLEDHTPSQVVGGTALGALVAMTVFTLLR